MTQISAKDKKKLLKIMLTSRLGDLREQSLIRQGKGWFHVSAMGHEALTVVGQLLKDGDFFAGYYRDRPIALGRGVSNREMALSFFAKKDGASGGRQMPAHYSDKKLGIFSIASVVAASLLPACGLAWGIKLDKKPNLVVTTVGDAGTRQGDFFESIAFAREKNLPILFIVEDNGIGISSPTGKINPLALEVLDKKPWQMVDGCSADEMHATVSKAMQKIRKGAGPQFLWCRTERISSHSSADDQRKYRSSEELEALEQKDPIERLKQQMIADGQLTAEEFESLKSAADTEVRKDYEEAFSAADPEAGDVMQHIFAPSGRTPQLELKWDDKRRMVDAINDTFHAGLDKSEDFVFFGQDIEDPKGGVFSLTSGLSSKHPERVKNSPLAESTIIGVSVGLAAYGKRPVFEIQFADYIWPGLNQLVTHLSTLHWRTHGEWTAPAVLYAPYGAYLPGGALWHSQTNEAALAHFPGIQIAIPSSPEDAAGLFWTAMHDNNPTVILIPKHLMWRPRPVESTAKPVPFGVARVLQKGNDITIVTWGNGVEVIEETLPLVDESVSVEVIDVRSIVPLDLVTILDSVRKTGRLLVVQEDAESCSIGQKILAKVTSSEVFHRLQSPPVLISKADVHIGYNPNLEYSALPDKKAVAKAIYESVNQSRQQVATSSPTVTKPLAAAVTQPSSAPEPSEEMPVDNHILEIRVPILGEGITSAKVIALLYKVGEAIEPDDALCEVETDKALFPIESSYSGELLEWHIAEGDEVEVHQVIATLRSDEALTAARVGGAPAESAHRPQKASSIRPTEGGLSPHILAQIRNVAPAHMTVKVGWTAIRKAREEAKKRKDIHTPSPTTMVAWAITRAMERCPIFTCTISPQETLYRHEHFDLGIAVALPDDALETAIIEDANNLSWQEFAPQCHQAILDVREGKVSSKSRVPLILTSMGAYGVRDALPVVVPPAIATLFMGEAHLDALAGEKPQEKVSLCLSFDHRWMNGVAASQFMAELRKEMEAFSIDNLVNA
jgi:2-oxoisovalerate dehydrogenase E1 component